MFGLIGFPLGHSFSKEYFNNKFISEHISNVDFQNFELESLHNLYQLIKENPQLGGFTVTIPYKEAILPLMNKVSKEVEEIQALNVVKISRQGEEIYLSGYNTDVYGFEKSLREQNQPHHRQALVLGRGGAAKAVAFVLERSGIDYLFVSRNPENKHTIAYKDLIKEIIDSHTMVINTTPLGMFPKVDSCPDIPYQYLSDKHFLFDLVYNPKQTVFLQKGMERGAKICNGYDMLCYQADKAWEIWNE